MFVILLLNQNQTYFIYPEGNSVLLHFHIVEKLLNSLYATVRR